MKTKEEILNEIRSVLSKGHITPGVLQSVAMMSTLYVMQILKEELAEDTSDPLHGVTNAIAAAASDDIR